MYRTLALTWNTNKWLFDSNQCIPSEEANGEQLLEARGLWHVWLLMGKTGGEYTNLGLNEFYMIKHGVDVINSESRGSFRLTRLEQHPRLPVCLQALTAEPNASHLYYWKWCNFQGFCWQVLSWCCTLWCLQVCQVSNEWYCVPRLVVAYRFFIHSWCMETNDCKATFESLLTKSPRTKKKLSLKLEFLFNWNHWIAL